jgi:DNA-binding IclR family transcriptional regulator
MRDSRGTTVVQSVARASTLLHLLGDSCGYVQLGDLASGAGLAKSTAHGLLQTLVSEGLVEHDPCRGAYRLSPRVVLDARPGDDAADRR